MDTKIPSSFWTDPGNDDCDAETLLALLWIRTNERLNLLGFAEVSPRVYEFQTRKPFETFERACQALGKGIVRDGNRYWLRDFVREQIGSGESLAKNHMRKPLVRALTLVGSPSITEAILSEYPELTDTNASEGLAKPQSREEQRGEEKRGAEQSTGGAGGAKPARPARGESTRPDQHPEPMRSRMVAVAEVMKRRPESLWSDVEKKAFSAAGLLALADEDFAEQVAAMRRYYRATIPDAKRYQFTRRSTLPILLNNWPGELDKARAWAREAGGEGDGVKKI